VGVDRVWGGYLCTYSDPGRFFSYRRDGTTGRMASLVWIDPDS
jgi:copper oxidase (laccase) domain-containing protein